MANHQPFERYNPQMRLPGFGIGGQEKLSRARVLVVGAGGLGSVVLPYLAGAGVGVIGLADDDLVGLDNLHRQVIYTMNDIGKTKALQAAEKLKLLNPSVVVNAYPFRITPANIHPVLSGYDLVVDCTDDAMTRYVLNDSCVRLNIPMVYGAVYGHEGQLAVLNVDLGRNHSANYRDIFPHMDKTMDLSCNQTGVLGTLTAIIGSMQGQEVLKLLTGLGEPSINALLHYDGLSNRLTRFAVIPSVNSRTHILGEKFNTPRPGDDLANEVIPEIQPEVLHRYLDRDDVTLLDIRERFLMHTRVAFRHLHLPGTTIMDHLDEIAGRTVIVFCEKGIMSRNIAIRLQDIFGTKKEIFSLKHGISYWNQYHAIYSQTGA